MSRVGLLLTLGMLVVISFVFAADSPPPSPTKRQPWTTSKIVGSPEPAPRYKATNAFPNLKFTKPIAMTAMPGTNRLVVGEEQGKLFSFANAPDAKAEPFFDCRADITTVAKHPGAKSVDALYGVVFDPNFAQNRYCYLCYTLKGKNNEKNLEDGSRVSRFRVTTAEPPRLEPNSEEILLTFLQGGHNGGDLHFGYLYISTGDATDPNPPDIFKTGQDVSDLLSSILRIDVHQKQDQLNYAIPKDNPFVGQSHNGKPIRGEVWSYGFRNPWRMGFDRVTGDLYAGDVGWESWEMIHKIEKGSNHGWSIVEAGQTVNSHLKMGPTPIQPPTIEYSHALGGSVTGGYVYRGKKNPELYGQYIFGDWMTRRIWGAKFRDGQFVGMDDLTAPTVRIVAFAEDHFGELYLIDYDAGTIHTLVANDAAAFDSTKFPRTLSATGLFASTKAGTPANGVYPFQVNARQWQDYTTAEYWAAFPNLSAATDYEKSRELPGEVSWRPFHLHIPKNGVLVKTISYETEHGNAKTMRYSFTRMRGATINRMRTSYRATAARSSSASRTRDSAARAITPGRSTVACSVGSATTIGRSTRSASTASNCPRTSTRRRARRINSCG
jgi:glucose/arabinose dehydrogenase